MGLSDKETYTSKVIKLAATRHVRTVAGVEVYNKPIGSVITHKDITEMQRKFKKSGKVLNKQGQKYYEADIARLRAAITEKDPPKIHSGLTSLAKTLKKYNGDETTTKYVQFLLRKFFPNLPSPVRHFTKTGKLISRQK